MTLTFRPEGGLVTSRSRHELDADELAQAVGIYYKRGSRAAHNKAGRTSFGAGRVQSVYGGNAGIVWAEIDMPGADDQLLVRHRNRIVRANLGLTGTYTILDSSLDPYAPGLWHAFANNKYYLSDGLDEMKVFGWDVNTGTYFYSKAGLKPPTEQPTVEAQTSGSPATSRTVVTEISDPVTDFTNPANTQDADLSTYAYKTLRNKNQKAIRSVGNFSGISAGSNYSIKVRYEVEKNNASHCTTLIEYSVDGGSNYITAYTISDEFGVTDYVVSLVGTSVTPSQLFVRVTTTKNNDAGSNTPKAYDILVYQGAASGSQDIVTGLVYAITEMIPARGIQSVAGPRSYSTGAATGVYSVRVTLPSAPVNTDTTHYAIYRTVDAGAWPVATLAGVVPISATAFDDITTFNQIASTTTYRTQTIAGLPEDIDVEPPVATSMAVFQNLIVVAPTYEPDRIRYSAGSYPESFPVKNKIIMTSDRDDSIMGFATLGPMLGVFMRGRCKRIDHLPIPTDATFAVDPEDFAPDHGLESRDGLVNFSPGIEGGGPKIAYVARDGIRVTNLYDTAIVTGDIAWDDTVDVTQLSSSKLINVASENRLEFYFTPTQAFRDSLGWPSTAQCQMWLQYNIEHVKQGPLRFKVTVHPVVYLAAASAPVNGKDRAFILSSDSVLYVDEQGSGDAMHAFDSLGTVQRLVTWGRTYHPDMMRWRCKRIFVERPFGTLPMDVIVTAGRDDTDQEMSTSRGIPGEGKANFWPNISGQWIQISYNASSASGTPAPVNEINVIDEAMGTFT